MRPTAIELSKFDEITSDLSAAESFAYMMTVNDFDDFRWDIKSNYAGGLQKLLKKINDDLNNLVFPNNGS